jgi:hypothetical protein
VPIAKSYSRASQRLFLLCTSGFGILSKCLVPLDVSAFKPRHTPGAFFVCADTRAPPEQERAGSREPSYVFRAVYRHLRDLHSFWLTSNKNIPTIINAAMRVPTISETTQFRRSIGFDPALFCAAPIPNQKRSLSIDQHRATKFSHFRAFANPADC